MLKIGPPIRRGCVRHVSFSLNEEKGSPIGIIRGRLSEETVLTVPQLTIIQQIGR